MSRCFPYPPPGYTLSGARNEALIESIKLQKEKQRKKEKKEKRKENRREKKEKGNERKEIRIEKKDETSQCLMKSDILNDHISQKNCLHTKDEFQHKRKDAESEQFEKSSVTEEHGRPNSLPVPSSSSETTENSNKRKRQTSLTDSSRGHSKAILIRLPSKMQNEFDTLAKAQELCSRYEGTDCPAQHKDNTGLRNRPENLCYTLVGTSNIGGKPALGNNSEQICSTSGQIEAVAPGKTGIRSMPNGVVNSMKGVEIQYKNLVENWFPPQIQDTTSLYPVDLDWLYQDRTQDIRADKRQRSGSDSASCSRSLALWPRAEYFHEIDAYALPFVVPY